MHAYKLPHIHNYYLNFCRYSLKVKNQKNQLLKQNCFFYNILLKSENPEKLISGFRYNILETTTFIITDFAKFRLIHVATAHYCKYDR
jgi:hypothetical protein